MRAIFSSIGLIAIVASSVNASAAPAVAPVQAIIEPMDLRLREANLMPKATGKRLDAQFCRTSRTPASRHYAIEVTFLGENGAVIDRDARNVTIRSNSPRRQPACAYVRLQSSPDVARVEMRVRGG